MHFEPEHPEVHGLAAPFSNEVHDEVVHHSLHKSVHDAVVHHPVHHDVVHPPVHHPITPQPVFNVDPHLLKKGKEYLKD